MITEQNLYELLTRTDHPVFKRDYGTTTDEDSPYNSIVNRVISILLLRAHEKLQEVRENIYPHLVGETGIVDWENRFFGFTKEAVEIENRRVQLQARINSRVGMTVGDVVDAAVAFTGETPTVIRNAFYSGWALDQAPLDAGSIFSGLDNAENRQTYFVLFSKPISTNLLERLDKELTKIEKGGSRHFISAPPALWVLDESEINIDTTLG